MQEFRMKEEIEECTGRYRDTLIALQDKMPYDPHHSSIDGPAEVRSRRCSLNLSSGLDFAGWLTKRAALAAGIEPAISYLGNKRLIHWATRAR